MKKQHWINQKVLADELKVSIQTVGNWVLRGNINWKLEKKTGKYLVDKNSLNVRHYKIKP